MASKDRHTIIPGTQPVIGEASRSTEGPTAQQWQEVKEEIRDLYMRKPLKEVRLILDQRYGFRATYVGYVPSLSTARLGLNIFTSVWPFPYLSLHLFHLSCKD